MEVNDCNEVSQQMYSMKCNDSEKLCRLNCVGTGMCKLNRISYFELPRLSFFLASKHFPCVLECVHGIASELSIGPD